MSDLQKLARRLLALEDRIAACMKCGLCQAVCPMFGATMMEADVARGKLALIDNLAHEMFNDPEANSPLSVKPGESVSFTITLRGVGGVATEQEFLEKIR